MNGYQGGVGRKNWEIGIDVYTLLCVESIASGKLQGARIGALW